MKPWSGLVRFLWALSVSACLTETVSADCGSDCAYCSLQLGLQQTHISSTQCVLQCEGNVDTGASWSFCQDLLQTIESTSEAEQISIETTSTPQHHKEEKKYGGFMKRYGGFMKRYGGFMKRYGGFMKKAVELNGLDEVDRGKEILSKSDMEMLANQVEMDGEKEEDAMRVILNAKKETGGVEGLYNPYGEFVRKDYDSVDGVRPLQKRYGGFMRRVGRPDWDLEPKLYRGFLKRSELEEKEQGKSPKLIKRYGGFMNY